MKWDYASVTSWGLDQVGLDGQDRFVAVVGKLAQALTGDVEMTKPLNGYQQGFQVVRDGGLLAQCFTAGTGAAEGSSQFVAANTAHEVYPVLQDLLPSHQITRLDACEDYSGDGVWDRLVALLTRIATECGVTMAPFGEGHVRPDGTRDVTKGRSWYFGSKSSAFRIVLYEKGLQQIALGIPADPTWVRLEVRVRPSSKAKGLIANFRPQPVDLLGMSSWGLQVAQALGADSVERFNIGSVWKPSEQEQVAMRIVRMFDRGLDNLLEQCGSVEAVGRLLYQVKAKANEAGSLLESVKA